MVWGGEGKRGGGEKRESRDFKCEILMFTDK